MGDEYNEREVMEKLVRVIDDKVELSVTVKISHLSKWIIGTIITVAAMLITILISNSYFMGKMDAQYSSIVEYIKEQKLTNEQLKKINESLSEKLNETESNQMVIMANMKRLDPTFVMPFQLRVGSDTSRKQ